MDDHEQDVQRMMAEVSSRVNFAASAPSDLHLRHRVVRAACVSSIASSIVTPL